MASIRKLKNKKFIAEIRKSGQYKSKTFDTKIQAMAWAAETEQGLDTEGSLPVKTLAEALTRYRDEISPAKKSYKNEYNRINKFLRQPLASKYLSEITARDLYEWIDEWLIRIKSSSVNRDLNVLSAVFEQAKRWEWTENNPVRGVRRPKNPKPRERRISKEEIDSIIDSLGFDGKNITTAKDVLAVAFLLALETAMRQGELWKLTWEHVFLEKRYVRLIDTKNGTDRDVPLTAEAADLFRLLSPEATGKVFRTSQAAAGVTFRKHTKKLGIVDITFHDARHESLTRLARKLDVLDLARMVGHRDPRSLMIYYNASAEEIATRLE